MPQSFAQRILDTAYRAHEELFGRRIYYKFNKLLFNVSCRGLGIYGNLQKSEEQFLKKLRLHWQGQTNPVVFDVGANEGQYALLVGATIPNAEVHSFEPNPFAFEKLKDVQSAHPKSVRVYNCGLGADAGVLPFYDYVVEGSDDLGTQHGSLIKEVISELHHRPAKEISVNIKTLDSVVQELGIKTIDLLKIDVEGYEMEVLRGSKTILAQGKVKVVQFEFNSMNVYSRVFFRDFFEVLAEYDMYRLLRHGSIKLPKYNPLYHELFGLQNIVAIHKSLNFSI